MRSLALPGLGTIDELNNFKPFMNFVLGFIAFTVGATLYFSSLKNTGKRIGLLLLCEALVTPTIVFVLLYFVGRFLPAGEGVKITREVAVLLAGIAIAGAPGTTVLVIQEARSRGSLTKTLVAAIGLIDMVAVGVFVFLAGFLDAESTWTASLTNVGFQFLVTFAIGALLSVVALVLTCTIVSPTFLGPTMVALILGSWDWLQHQKDLMEESLEHLAASLRARLPGSS